MGPEDRADELATMVHHQWTEEMRARGLGEVLPVRWSVISAPDSSRRARSGAGQVFHADDFVAAFAALPRRQLLIVGSPGAGKTTVAMLLTLDLLRRRAPGDPVPVLLPAAAWDPGDSVDDFMVRHLTDHYYGGRRSASEITRELVAQRAILPVIDGVDELRDATVAFKELSRYAGAGGSFVATSRAAAYGEGLAKGVVPPAMTVVELEPPPVDAVASFLASSVPSSDKRWRPLIEALRADPAGPLAAALATPQFVQLARSIYSQADSAPSELLDIGRFPTREAIETHLLGRFVAAVFPEPGGPYRSPAYSVRAYRWLSALANRLDNDNATTIGLPELTGAVPPYVSTAVSVLLAAVAGAAGLLSSRWLGLMLFILVLANTLATGRRPASFQRIGLRRNAELVWAWFLLGILASGSAVVIGLILAEPVARTAVVAVGACFAPMAALTIAVGMPARGSFASNLRALAHADRRYAALCALLCGMLGLAAAAAGGDLGFAAGPVLAGVLVGVTGTASCRLLMSALWLRARGEAPLGLLSFLEAAQGAGVLRQKGSVYQFRHAALQEYLSEHGDAPDAVQPPKRTPASTAIEELRTVLVEAAFEQATVRYLIEPDRIGRLKDEIGAELSNDSARVASATTAQWDRLADARRRYLDQAGIPRPASVSIGYAAVAGFLAAVALTGVALHVWNAGGPLAALALVAGGAVLIELPLLEVWRRAAVVRGEANEGEEQYWPGARIRKRRRWWRGLRRIRIFPEPWWPWARWSALVLGMLGVAELVVYAIRDYSVTRASTLFGSLFLLVTTGVAVVLGLVWLWSRPWHRRLVALRAVNKAAWPSADEMPWAVSARRLAVQAWNEWSAAVVDLGVLPLISAKVEPLTRRSYDTELPPVSVERLGDITEGVQFVATAESDRLSRTLASTLTAAIGVSGPRGVGKTTLLRRFGDQRIGSSTDNLMLFVSAPTSYNGRDFLVHLFARLCQAVLPPGDVTTEPGHARRRVRAGWPWVSALAGALLMAGAIWWDAAAAIPLWLAGHLRPVALGAGVVLLLLPTARTVLVRRRRPRDGSVHELARQHLRRLRYLETLTVTRGATVKTPASVDATASMARQRAEQIRTYPQLVGDFREFLGLVGLHLRSRPGRAYSRVVICVDELDKIATAEQAEQFLNDLKTIFGVDGCVFLVAVSEDALSSFARRALTTRTTFDTAFDDIITLRRFGLADTRRLLVQRVLRLPEPYVWLCHCLSGGLPRDLNRAVRLLYDVHAHRGMTDFAQLAAELVRHDLDSVAYGQALKLADQSDPPTARLTRWLSGARGVSLTAGSIREYAKNAPTCEDPEKSPGIVLMTEQFAAYLDYVAAVLDRFCERTGETIDRLRDVTDDNANPVVELAAARAELAADPVTARASVDAFLANMDAEVPPA
ncbi:hypothetical protein ACQP2F_11360 [Actinoplanes sp. CA-030573]|uniref:hypothetical protein n=1 Tax=Actinoplanes sp. CA-030573 TaxID=3239898 RepID=UPI003D8D08A3